MDKQIKPNQLPLKLVTLVSDIVKFIDETDNEKSQAKLHAVLGKTEPSYKGVKHNGNS